MAEKSEWNIGAKMTTAWNAEDWAAPPACDERRPFFVRELDTGVDLQCVARSHMGGPWWTITFEIVERLTPPPAGG